MYGFLDEAFFHLKRDPPIAVKEICIENQTWIMSSQVDYLENKNTEQCCLDVNTRVSYIFLFIVLPWSFRRKTRKLPSLICIGKSWQIWNLNSKSLLNRNSKSLCVCFFLLVLIILIKIRFSNIKISCSCVMLAAMVNVCGNSPREGTKNCS